MSNEWQKNRVPRPRGKPKSRWEDGVRKDVEVILEVILKKQGWMEEENRGGQDLIWAVSHWMYGCYKSLPTILKLNYSETAISW